MATKTDKRTQIKAVLLTLAKLFGRSEDPGVLDFMVSRLEDFEPGPLIAALNAAALDRLKAGESLLGMVLRHLHGDPETVAAIAWAGVLRSIEGHRDTNVVFSDPAITVAVEQLGGRGWLGNMDGFALGQARRDFAALYLDAARAGGEPEENAPDGGLLLDSGTLCGRRLTSGQAAQLALPAPAPEWVEPPLICSEAMLAEIGKALAETAKPAAVAEWNSERTEATP